MDRIDELQVFVAILDAGSLNGAARRLGRSSPAVTRALASVEERMGVRLIERTTRKLMPTDAGVRLGEMARRVLLDYEQAVGEAQPDGPLRGKLRITAPHVFGRRHLSPAVIEFLDLHPGLQVEMVFNDRNMDLIEHGLDLALRIGHLPDTSMVARQLGTVRRVLLASPAYLARAGSPESPAALSGHALIFSSAARTVPEWRFRHEGRELNVKLDPRLVVNEVDAAVMAVMAGRGIGRHLSYQVTDQLADGSLVRLLPDYEPAPLPVHLVMQSGRYLPPRLRALVDFLVERLSALPVLR